MQLTISRGARAALLTAFLLPLAPPSLSTAASDEDSSKKKKDAQPAPELAEPGTLTPLVFWADWSADGFVDAWVVQPDGSGRLLENDEKGSFIDRTAELGLDGVTGCHMVAWADVDGDRRLDLYLAAWHGSSRLYLQQDSGQFADVSATSGLPSTIEPVHAEWIDYDNDGDPDLHLITVFDDLLYRNLGRSHFERVDLGVEPRTRSTVGTAWAKGSVDEARAAIGLTPLGTTSVAATTGSGGAVGVAPLAGAQGSLICAGTIEDMATGMCIPASSIPTPGMLYPISNEWFVDATSGNVGIGTMTPVSRLSVEGEARAERFVSTVPTGVPPFEVQSNTMVPELNADELDGFDASHFRQRSVPLTGADIVSNSIGFREIAPDSVRSSELAPNAVDTTHVVDGSLVGADLANDTIDFRKIATDAVRSDEIDTAAVGSDEVADGSLTGVDIANGSLGLGELAGTGAAAGQVPKWSGSAWVPSADVVGVSPWQTSGSSTYYPAGNVGIGGTAGGRTLTLRTNAGAPPILSFQGAPSWSSYWELQHSAFGAGRFGLVRYNNGVADEGRSMILNSSGSVGIGTASPAYKLDVNGWLRAGESDWSYLLTGWAPVAGLGNTRVIGNYLATVGEPQTRYQGESGTFFDIGTRDSGDFVIESGDTPRFRLKPDGTLSAGRNTSATGEFSTALGVNSTASGRRSTSLNGNTIASGNNSLAAGRWTRAEAMDAVAIGRNNVGGGTPDSWDWRDPLFEIGNGFPHTNAPHNALTILKDGSFTSSAWGNTGPNSNHAAYFENRNGLGADGVAIKINKPQADLHSGNNFLTFYDNADVVVGSVEGFSFPNDWVSPPPLPTPYFDLDVDLTFTTWNVPNPFGGTLVSIPVPNGVTSSFGIGGVSANDFADLVCWANESGFDMLLTTNPVDLLIAVDLALMTAACNDGGVTYSSKGADYAEWLERLDPEEKLAPGMIVGVHGGKISKDTAGAEQILAISSKPIVLGNTPDEGQEELFEQVGFMGQVPTLVLGEVEVGDYILASGDGDGFGRAVGADELTASDLHQVLGRAWSESEGRRVSLINVAVGLDRAHVAGLLESQVESHQRLEQQVEALEDRLARATDLEARLQDRLARMTDLEARLEALEAAVAEPR